jgi:hypothetical protein
MQRFRSVQRSVMTSVAVFSMLVGAVQPSAALDLERFGKPKALDAKTVQKQVSGRPHNETGSPYKGDRYTLNGMFAYGIWLRGHLLVERCPPLLQLKRVEKDEQAELRDEVKDLTNIIAKVSYAQCLKHHCDSANVLTMLDRIRELFACPRRRATHWAPPRPVPSTLRSRTTTRRF